MAVFGVFAGLHVAFDAHPARSVQLTGQVTDYHEHHGKSTYRYLYVDGLEYNVENPNAYSPPVSSYAALIGHRISVYINQGTTDVIALQDEEGTLHAGAYYLHPEEQLYWTLAGGLAVLLVALPALSFALAPLLSRRTEDPLLPPSVRSLQVSWPVAVAHAAVLVVLAGGLVWLLAIQRSLSL